jgi:AmmeMemoRadiSam system protein A
MNPDVKLAREAIDSSVRQGEVIAPPDNLSPEMRAGVFVTIKKDGNLGGCIRAFLSTQGSIAHAIISDAIESATGDPRFHPVSSDEFDDLTVSADILSAPEECMQADLDPARYRVIVESGWRRGLLLPDLPQVKTVEEQLEIEWMQAGIGPDEPLRVYRFTVTRHT